MDLLHISQNIRSVRISQGMTVEQLAVKSGFSKGFISQVENFRVTPSLKALGKLSDALGLNIADLFLSESPAPEFSFGRLDQGEEVLRNDSLRYGIHYHSLAYRQIGRLLEPFIIEYTPSCAERGDMMHDTEEFFVVLQGALEFHIMQDHQVRVMCEGDTLYMKANIPHRVRLAENCTYAKALSVYASTEERGGHW